MSEDAIAIIYERLVRNFAFVPSSLFGPNEPTADQRRHDLFRNIAREIEARLALRSPPEPSAGWRGNSSSQSQPSTDAGPNSPRSPRGEWVLADDGALDVLVQRLQECADIAGENAVGKITASYMAIAMLAARQQIMALRQRMAIPDSAGGLRAALETVKDWDTHPDAWDRPLLGPLARISDRALSAAPARPTGDSDEVPGKPHETGELEEHKALSPLVGEENGSSNASRAATGPLPRIAPDAEPSAARSCTCHPDDKPPVPCSRRYALGECRAVAAFEDFLQVNRLVGLGFTRNSRILSWDDFDTIMAIVRGSKEELK